MFDLPDAKRVRREDLYASDSDSEDETSKANTNETQEKLRAQLALLYGPVTSPLPPSTASQDDEELPDAPVDEHDDDADEGFEFCLFAPTPKAATTAGVEEGLEKEGKPKVQKIILSHSDDEDEERGEGALVRGREDGWWIAKTTEEQKTQFMDVEVTPQMIQRWKEQRYFGSERPWRVAVVRTGMDDEEVTRAAKAMRKDRAEAGVQRNVGKPKSNTKPNKKKRILLRQLEKAAKEATEAEKIRLEKHREEKMAKDEDWAVKRAARNRERKIKKKARDKRKKEALKAGLPEPKDSGSEDEGKGGVKEKEVGLA